MPESILKVDRLCKSYGDLQAVKGVSFEIFKGEIFSLLGPNGAGKTTTLAMLCGLLKPTSGDAILGGYSILRQPIQVKKMIGVIPQDLALYYPLSARQNLNFWGRLQGMDHKQLQKRSDEVLEQVALLDRANDRVETFSGGMQRRLNVAIGLLHRPEFLLMDEPTVGIDPQSRRGILDLIKELRSQGITILYTTHYMEEAAEISDRVGIMDHGELIALGTHQELIQMIGQQQILKLRFPEDQNVEALADLLRAIPGVISVAVLKEQLVLEVPDPARVLPYVVTAAQQAQATVKAIEIEEPSLEAVFLHLTGRGLRN